MEEEIIYWGCFNLFACTQVYYSSILSVYLYLYVEKEDYPSEFEDNYNIIMILFRLKDMKAGEKDKIIHWEQNKFTKNTKYILVEIVLFSKSSLIKLFEQSIR